MNELDKIFQPKSIAVIGASDRPGTVGNALIKNLLNRSFQGKIYPVNHKHPKVAGVKSYRSVSKIRESIDLVVIATPARTVPVLLKECGSIGIKAAVIISAGFKEAGKAGEALFSEIKKISKLYGIRIIGPNCLGIINTKLGMNASFASQNLLPGRIAMISQSGAICTAIHDWSVEQSVGFSHFVSIGSKVDVGFHELIEYFGNDPETSSILLYIESLENADKFLAAAKTVSLRKPIIVLKAGRSSEGAKASLSHTGSLAGDDEIYRTGFRSAGILQVDTIAQLFNCAQALAMQPLPKGNRLAIVTNAGGPGIMATDYLIEKGGKLADFSKKTIEKLNTFLPSHWSKNNPADVLGDASAEKYAEAIRICSEDENVDAILAVLTPVAVTEPLEVAKAVVAQKIKKPILACWLGEKSVIEAREVLEAANIPNYRFPESVADVFVRMVRYSENLKFLKESSPVLPEYFEPNRTEARTLIKQITDSNRYRLTESEAKSLLNYYGIPTPSGKIVGSAEAAGSFASKIGFPVVMKIASSDIGHKIDVGGVLLNIRSAKAAEEGFDYIIENVKRHRPNAHIAGVRIEQMIDKKYELLIGAKKDPVFGHVIVFGTGGSYVELYKDTAMELSPLNMLSAKRLIEKTKVSKILSGYRGKPPVNLEELQNVLVKFSRLLTDFPQIKEIDLNPYSIDETGGLALDAHVVLESFEKKKSTVVPVLVEQESD